MRPTNTITLMPDSPVQSPSVMDDVFQHALSAHQSGQLTTARQLYAQILTARPDHADALHLMGIIHCVEGRLEEGAAMIAGAVALQPQVAIYQNSLGNAMQELGRIDMALACFTRALKLAPDMPEALLNRGNAWRKAGRSRDAAQDYEAGLALRPGAVELLVNLGIALHGMGQLDAALERYDEALAVEPSNPRALWNKALVLLSQGDFEHGLPLYEWRFPVTERPYPHESFIVPQWTGQQPLAGRTILLHDEQGLGDTIQFCRYVRLVAAQGANVVLQVQPDLVPLLKDLEGASQVIARGGALPPFDCHAALPSLPLAFRTRVESIPAYSSYISSPAGADLKWSDRAGRTALPRIGITWSSTSAFDDDVRRSVALADFLAALPAQGFDYICLQKEIRPQDEAALASRPDIRFFGDELGDFSDTAALAATCDLVISTCTSVPHLAGAMGRPTWILLSNAPDWRWLETRSDSPWYPSVTLYRQATPGDWAGVFARVREDLGTLGATLS